MFKSQGWPGYLCLNGQFSYVVIAFNKHLNYLQARKVYLNRIRLCNFLSLNCLDTNH